MTTFTSTSPERDALLITWESMADGSVPKVGDAATVGQWRSKCVQVSGTFGVGGSLSMEGSNDGVVWSTLSDIDLGLITITAAAMHQIWESPRFIRPNLTAGDGTTDLLVTVFCTARGGSFA